MSKDELLIALNQYALTNDQKPIVDMVNIILDSDSFDEYKELIFKFISTTQYYGFLQYFDSEIRNEFLDFDFFTSSSYKGSSLNYYNSGQLSLLHEMMINQKVFISAPTSFGKTSLISEMILDEDSEFCNILMIIPTNSLIEELFLKLNKLNIKHNLGYRITTQPVYAEGMNNIMLLTPERFLVIMETIDINLFDLVIMDETYKIVDYNDQSVSDFINRRSYRFRKVADIIGYSNSKVLYLSPYTYQLKESMIKFLEKYNIKRINRKMDYVTHKIIKMENSEDFRNYFSEGNYQKGYAISNKVSRIVSCLQGEKSIVYVSNYSKAYDIVNELPQVQVLHDERYNLFLNHMRENFTIDNVPNWKVVEGLEKGVGVYIAPLPRYIKKEIVDLYERGVLRTLIVTTAFTEGINTDAKHLIITSLVNGSTRNKLTELDLLNTVGRAGRFTQSSVGKVYCLSNEIYEKVINVKRENQVELENLNYNEEITGRRNDYELDMISDEFLSDYEIEKKHELDTKIEILGLSKSDLNISLNVSNKWKIFLYEFFDEMSEENHQAVDNYIRNIINDNGERVKGIEHIFQTINLVLSRSNEIPFPMEVYEVKPFDNNQGFTWGRMYSIYSSHNTKAMIKRNIEYISNRIQGVIDELPGEPNYETFVILARYRGEEWLKNYINKDLEIRYNKFYTETFKFISSVIQYKIPFYVTYYISVYKLYLSKKESNQELVELINLNKIITLFENNQFGDEYSILVDFGISNDILRKLKDNNISVEDLVNISETNFFDDYEKLIIEDVLQFIGRE